MNLVCAVRNDDKSSRMFEELFDSDERENELRLKRRLSILQAIDSIDELCGSVGW